MAVKQELQPLSKLMMQRTSLAATAICASLVLLSSARAQGADAGGTCKVPQDALKTINDKYQSTYKGFESEGKEIENDAVTFKFDVTWKDQEVIFDLPSVTIKDQKLIFGVPQVTMKMQDIIFGTPSVRMTRVKTGQYPEFYCDTHTLIPSCTVRWSDMYADVPQPFMQEQHIKTQIPEFTFADTQIIMGIPEFNMVRQRWVFGLPQFKLDSIVINDNANHIKDRSNDLNHRVMMTKEAQIKDDAEGIHGLYACYRDSVAAQRKDAETKFSSSLALMDGVIQNLRGQGADPTKVADGSGQVTDLVAKRADLATQRDKALAAFDAALSQLDTGEKAAVGQLNSPGQVKPAP